MNFHRIRMLLRDHSSKIFRRPMKPSVKKAREVMEGDQTLMTKLSGSQLVEMGWTATTIPEEFDGLGLGYLELCVIAEELGRSLAPNALFFKYLL